jgi:hypothetical protein
MSLSALLGLLQNGTAPMIIDDAPIFDFVERPKASNADVVVIQAAISYARRLNGLVDITHFY